MGHAVYLRFGILAVCPVQKTLDLETHGFAVYSLFMSVLAFRPVPVSVSKIPKERRANRLVDHREVERYSSKMRKPFAIGLSVSLLIALGTVALKFATESSRNGIGDFLLFSILPEFLQKRGIFAMYPAKSLLAALLFAVLFFAARKAGRMQGTIATVITTVVLIGMCFGDVVV